jgi:predicted protein tyrosine phosphatase
MAPSRKDQADTNGRVMRHILKVHREIIAGPVMDFLVLGRAEACHVSPEVPYIVISITTPEAPQALLAECPHRREVLRLQFHDIEEPQPELTVVSGEVVRLITEEDARSIVEFVQKHRGSVRLIVCQCDAGMSRSAGVGAALSRWLQKEDAAFFRHYLPNQLVYRTILGAWEKVEQVT